MWHHLSTRSFKKLKEERFLLKILLVVFAGVVSLTVAEAVLRITREQRIEPNDCRRFDADFETILIPNSTCRSKTGEWDVEYAINNWGTRGPDFNKEKQKDTFRIIIVGDSFVEGFGLAEEEMISTKLRNKLKEKGFDQIEVIGAGVAGYGTVQKSKVLLEKWLEFEPDLIIFEFNVTDFKEDSDAKSRMDESGKFGHPVLYQDQPIVNKRSFFFFVPEGLRNSLNQNIYSYQFLNTHAKIIIDRLMGKNVRTYSALDINSDLFAVTRDKIPNGYERLWQVPQESITKVEQSLNGQKVNLVIMAIPHGHMVNGSEWQKGRLYWGFERGRLYSNRAFIDLKQKFKNVSIFDLTDALKLSSRKLYYSRDGHLNSDGANIAADSLAEFLLAQRLIPR